MFLCKAFGASLQAALGLHKRSTQSEDLPVAGCAMHTDPRLQVAKNARSIGFLLRAVAALDIASARAKHAAWAGAVRPTFLTPEEAEQVGIACTVLPAGFA